MRLAFLQDIHVAKEVEGNTLMGGEKEEVKRRTFPKLDRLESEESRVTTADIFMKIGTCHEIFATAYQTSSCFPLPSLFSAQMYNEFLI